VCSKRDQAWFARAAGTWGRRRLWTCVYSYESGNARKGDRLENYNTAVIPGKRKATGKTEKF